MQDLNLKEDAKGRIWMPVTGTSDSGHCMHCGNLTPNHFYKLYNVDTQLGVLKRWCFCGEECLENFKKEIPNL
jgi:hypothetical protein